MKTSPSTTKGFTLVELLVVIAIIGVLVALLLPAVQQARESARRMSCGNNIRQIAISLHTYHDTMNALPINYGNMAYRDWTTPNFSETSTGRSWFCGILPFIEQQPLYDQINFSANLNNANNAAVSQTRIPSLLCPSDGSNGKGIMGGRANISGERAVNNYKACAGSNWEWGTFSPVAPVTGKWPSSTDGLSRGNGIICRNEDNQRANYIGLAAITDGTSNTFAIGECVPNWCTHTAWYWWNASTATCAVPLNFQRQQGAGYLALNANNWPDNYSFMSQHPAGGQFAYADGHVQFISNNVDFTAYRALSTVSGAEVTQIQ